MKVKKSTEYVDHECHKWARRAINAGTAVFGINADVEIVATGQWLLQKFPVSIDQECRLSNRGVYVSAPGDLTEQFLTPTQRSAITVTFSFDAEPAAGSGPSNIELDEDNPDGDE
jgi:hypothetical protein